MSFVVDASVAVKWLVDEPDHEKARWYLGLPVDLIAPDIALIEVGNALRKKVERTEISRDQARAGLEKLTRIFDILAPTAPLVPRALDLALDMRHPVYDCIYIACAEQTGATLVTDDRRLGSKVRSAGLTIMVQLLSGSDPIVTQ